MNPFKRLQGMQDWTREPLNHCILREDARAWTLWGCLEGGVQTFSFFLCCVVLLSLCCLSFPVYNPFFFLPGFCLLSTVMAYLHPFSFLLGSCFVSIWACRHLLYGACALATWGLSPHCLAVWAWCILSARSDLLQLFLPYMDLICIYFYLVSVDSLRVVCFKWFKWCHFYSI